MPDRTQMYPQRHPLAATTLLTSLLLATTPAVCTAITPATAGDLYLEGLAGVSDQGGPSDLGNLMSGYSSSWGIQGGLVVHQYLALEASYFNYGSVTFTDDNFFDFGDSEFSDDETSAVSLHPRVIGLGPALTIAMSKRSSLILQAGLTHWRLTRADQQNITSGTDGSTSTTSQHHITHGFGNYYGLTLEGRISQHISALLQYRRVQISHTQYDPAGNSLGSMNIGIGWRFN